VLPPRPSRRTCCRLCGRYRPPGVNGLKNIANTLNHPCVRHRPRWCVASLERSQSAAMDERVIPFGPPVNSSRTLLAPVNSVWACDLRQGVLELLKPRRHNSVAKIH
jgi:hypothetical protein